MPKNKDKKMDGYNMGGMVMGAVGSDKYMKKMKPMKGNSYGKSKSYSGYPKSPTKKIGY